MRTHTGRIPAAVSLRSRGAAAAACALVALALTGCYSNRFKRIESSIEVQQWRLDSLRTEHDRTRADLADTKSRLADAVRSMRAGNETSAVEMLQRLEQLEARLEDQSQQIAELSGRARTRSLGDSTTYVPPSPTPPAPSGSGSSGSTRPPATSSSGPTGSLPAPSGGVRVDPTAAYDQAVVDFTQGRFDRSLAEFRSFVTTYPTSDLADNAQYGVGEAFYAMSSYDSAAVEYRRVVDVYPNADKVPAALYKLGITYQKTNRSAEARATYRTLSEKYPRSGEARLAAERLRELDAR
jgi:tol-pal system protein YbgF